MTNSNPTQGGGNPLRRDWRFYPGRNSELAALLAAFTAEVEWREAAGSHDAPHPQSDAAGDFVLPVVLVGDEEGQS